MKAKLRVLLVDHAPIFGGVEAMIIDLLRAADGEAFSLAVATDTASPVEFGEAEVRRIGLPRLRGNWGALIPASIRLARIAGDMDLLMSTTARTHVVAGVAARLARKPLVWRLADDTLPMPLARALGGIPRRIVAVSSYIAGRCSPRADKTVVIPDGLPDSGPTLPEERERMRQALRLATDDVAAVMIARLVRWKGHAVFARAVKLSGVTGLIAGGQDESVGELGGRGLRQELEEAADQIQFLGHRSDLREVLAASDIFVQASTRPEPFGRGVVQAMLAGLPVVATRAGAIPEVVGHAGRLVPSGDAEAMAAALRMDSETRHRLGREARERALARFELHAVTRRLEEVWRDAAG